MADNKTEWKMRGNYLKNCNCDPGCPCDYWASPTHHKCDGMVAMEIDEGHYGDVNLDGVKYALTYHWPGPLHEGNGTAQPILDESTTPEQREALFAILTGQAGNAWFEVLASVITTILEPKFLPIEFNVNVEERTAKVSVPGIFETISKPITNGATGDELRVRIDMPQGMEYKFAETAIAVVNKGTGDIKYDCPNSHSSLAFVEHTQDGLVS